MTLPASSRCERVRASRMNGPEGARMWRVVAALIGALLVLLSCADARAATTPTETILTGGKLTYSGSATADMSEQDGSESVTDHAAGTFTESWLVSPYQAVLPAVYSNSLSWDPG